jgi:hypothetical protein
MTSLIFLLAIAGIIIYLSRSQKDIIVDKSLYMEDNKNNNGDIMQTIITI